MTLALALAGALCAPAPAAEPLVDRDPPGSVATKLRGAGAGALADVRSLAHYTGRANPAPALRARAFSLTVPGTGEVLRFEDLERAEVEGGYTLSTPVGAEGPRLELVVLGRTLHGTVTDGDDLYVITPLGEGRTLVHRQGPDDVEPAPHAAPHEHPKAEEGAELKMHGGHGHAHPAGPAAKATGAPVVDVLFVHTDRAAEFAGDIRARVALMVLKVNQMLARSHVAARIRSVGVHRTPYQGHDHDGTFPQRVSTSLARVRNPDDGHMDDVHAVRERVGADVVALLVTNRSASVCGGGIAAVMHYRHAYGQDRRAFLASGVGGAHCPDGDAGTVAHELGHLHGALHNPEQYDGNPDDTRFYPYGYGYCYPAGRWRTVMSTRQNGTCWRESYHFSNPDAEYAGLPTGTAHRHDVARLLDENAPFLAAFLDPPAPPRVYSYHLPLLPAADAGALLGFVRLHNRTQETAEIQLYAYDETGARFGPLATTLHAGRARGFDAKHFEGTREGGHLDGTLPDGEGQWRLWLRTETPIEVRAYTRSHETGFASAMHQMAVRVPDSAPRAYHLPFVNPGSNLGSRGIVRIANPSAEPNTVRLFAWDDRGEAAEFPVTVTVEPRATVALNAQELEAGAAHFAGRFGDGAGKWRVRVESEDHRTLFVQGLVATRDGSLRNVSR